MALRSRIPATTAPFSYAQKRDGGKQGKRVKFIEWLNTLAPEEAQAIFVRNSREEGDSRLALRHAKTWRALEVLYTFEQRRAEGLVDDNDIFWEETLDSARSTRNRLLLVKEELAGLIRAIGSGKRPVHVLSIGSGSARPVLETIASLRGTPEVLLQLVDMDATALRFSEQLGKTLNINHTTQITGNFLRIKGECAPFQPQVIEMVGLLDYLNDRWCRRLLGDVLDLLVPGGYLLTGNVAPNLEAPFVTKGINWPMTYRRPEELQKLLVRAGFTSERIRIIQEPLEIHTLAIAQKR